MQLVDKLERIFGRFAVPHLTVLLVIGQALGFFLLKADPTLVEYLLPDLAAVARGEVWRLMSFIILPPGSGLLWTVIALWVFHFIGSTLEAEWGTFRYNLYIVLYIIAVNIASCFGGSMTGVTLLLDTSVFLAFARLFPNFEFLLFFLVPVRVKYLALFTWALLAFTLLQGEYTVLAVVANYLIFFAADMRRQLKAGQRRMDFEAKQRKIAAQTLHRCAACGCTENDEPDMVFRVCSTCVNGEEYCEAHIRNHEHRLEKEEKNDANS